MGSADNTADLREVAHAVAALVQMVRLLPVDQLRCPMCGTTVKWSCGTGEYPTGHAHCENGMNVSRRLGSGNACEWMGTPLVRLLDDVYAPLPVRLGRVGGGASRAVPRE